MTVFSPRLSSAVAVVVAFFLCWFPFHAQRLMAVNSAEGYVASQWKLYVILNQCSGILYFLSTCINPLLYNIMSHKFRDAFKVCVLSIEGEIDSRWFCLANCTPRELSSSQWNYRDCYSD